MKRYYLLDNDPRRRHQRDGREQLQAEVRAMLDASKVQLIKRPPGATLGVERQGSLDLMPHLRVRG